MRGRNEPVEAAGRALGALLDEDGYAPGAKLPTERALAERLSISRSAVRTALAKLEAQGRILRIIGSGTYVAETSPYDGGRASRSHGSRDASPREIMETRQLIEPLLAALVVAHANGADMDTIRTAAENAEAAGSGDEFELWDGRFHQAIADAAHNRLMTEIYHLVSAARDQAEWGELKRRSLTPERRSVYEAEHRAILQALQARDAAGAEQAIAAHIRTVRRNLLG